MPLTGVGAPCPPPIGGGELGTVHNSPLVCDGASGLVGLPGSDTPPILWCLPGSLGPDSSLLMAWLPQDVPLWFLLPVTS